ncbi:opsin-5-like [Clarias magur]|uniref:Opsin-5-like n=1 Tax=Clarias magur TaxID=1594786 RepID=A0A8J4TWE7_CLAMG|nr:opsin-5-like [Clarias magur]
MSSIGALEAVNIPWRNNNFSLLSKDPPLSDQGDTIIGVYLLLLGWLSWFGNSIVIFVLFKQRASLQPTDYLTLNLAISDASISVFGYSRGILEIFNVFHDNGYLITSVWTCQVAHSHAHISHGDKGQAWASAIQWTASLLSSLAWGA